MLVRTATVCLLAGLTAAPAAGQNCNITSTGRIPLIDLGTGLYLGQFEGGLYPGGGDEVPATHRDEGLTRLAQIQPRDTAGQPSPSGKHVLLSVGMSNTTQEFCSQPGTEPCDAWTFMGQAAADGRVNATTLVIVNGARGGQAAATWDQPTDANYDRVRDQVLAPKGLSEAQVQIAWVKVANPQPTVSLPNANADAYMLTAQIGNILRALKTRYPNMQLAFVSCRIYAGYAQGVSTLNPEPYAYEAGFACKWVIEAQIEQMAGGPIDPRAGDLGESVAPWVAWGPYLWADGLNARADGMIWDCSDLQSDGTHPAMPGEQKVGTMLLNFMLYSPFAAPWFRQPCPAGPDTDGDGIVDACDNCPGVENPGQSDTNGNGIGDVCEPPSRSIIGWRSVRSHQGAGDLPMELKPAAHGSGPGGPSVEPRTGGIQQIEVKFNGTIVLVDETRITVTGRRTIGNTLQPPVAYTTTDVAVSGLDALILTFAPGLLPDQACYAIEIGDGAIDTAITGDRNVNIRALTGDTTQNGENRLSDPLLIRARLGQPVAASPQLDLDLNGSISLADALIAKAPIARPPRRALCP